MSEINALEPQMEQMSDEELASAIASSRSASPKRRGRGQILLVDVFAVVREAAKRDFGMRHFDVQLMGGIASMRGR